VTRFFSPRSGVILSRKLYQCMRAFVSILVPSSHSYDLQRSPCVTRGLGVRMSGLSGSPYLFLLAYFPFLFLDASFRPHVRCHPCFHSTSLSPWYIPIGALSISHHVPPSRYILSLFLTHVIPPFVFFDPITKRSITNVTAVTTTFSSYTN